MAISMDSTRSLFMRSIFESNVIESLKLLTSLLNISIEGYDQALELLAAWQDLISKSDSPLCPLLEVLHDHDECIVLMSLDVLLKIIRKSPNSLNTFRICNELKELGLETLLLEIRERFGPETAVSVLAEHWYTVVSWIKQNNSIENTKTDEMVSSDIEPIMVNIRHLLEKTATSHRQFIVNEIIETLSMQIEQDETHNEWEKNSKHLSSATVIAPLAPPPPPIKAPPPPIQAPPPAPNGLNATRTGDSSHGPPPPPPLNLHMQQAKTMDLPEAMKPKKELNKQLKMKTLMWSKLAPSVALSADNASVWAKLATEKGLSLDFDILEGMFSMATEQNQRNSDTAFSPIARKKDAQVDLLSTKRSQNVTITLKRFKDLEGLLCALQHNEIDLFDVEMLKTLKNILPDKEEIEALERYSGNPSLLTPACSFFICLLKIPNYILRIDCLLCELEFGKSLEESEPQLETVIIACNELLRSSSLRKLLLLLVNIGNYMNGSTAHGNAAGFKLNSLWKMIDLRAAKGGSTLLHAVAKMDSGLVSELETELSLLKPASLVSIEEIRTTVNQLKEAMIGLKSRLQNRKENEFERIREKLEGEFSKELSIVCDSLQEVSRLKDEVAEYFCENKNTFRVEECFKIFANFVARLRQAVKENTEKDVRAARKKGDIALLNGDRSPTIREVVLPSEDLFSTLQRSSSLKISRRRSSVQSVEQSRDRNSVIEARPPPKKEELNNIEKEEKSENEEKKTLEPARVTRRTRRSMHYEKAASLNEYIENLQQATFVPRPPLASRIAVVPEECNITVAIPNNDGCSSTAGSSPKSGSDEGFESEKDKVEQQENMESRLDQPEKKIALQHSEVNRVDETSNTESRPAIPIAVTRSQRPSLIKPPRLISVTTKSDVPSTRIPTSNKTVIKNSPKQTPTPPSRSISVMNLKSEQPIRITSQPPPRVPVPLKRPPTRIMSKTASLAKLPTAQVSTPKLAHGIGPAGPPTKQNGLPHTTTPQKTPVTTRRPPTSGIRPPLTRTATVSDATVSTSSRPALIKTGSLSQRPSLRGMDTLEHPRPLKKTNSTSKQSLSARSSTGCQTPPNIIITKPSAIPKPTSKPKWV